VLLEHYRGDGHGCCRLMAGYASLAIDAQRGKEGVILRVDRSILKRGQQRALSRLPASADRGVLRMDDRREKRSAATERRKIRICLIKRIPPPPSIARSPAADNTRLANSALLL
jgi:hypothetical protein